MSARGLALVGALSLLGCRGSGLTPDLPSDYNPGDPPPPPLLTEAEIEAGLQELVDEVLALDPVDLYVSYEAVRQQFDDNDPAADDACPEYDLDALTRDEFAWGADSCDALSGAVFNGDVFSRVDAPGEFVDGDGNIYQDHAALGVVGQIFDPNGGRFDLSLDSSYEVFSPPRPPR